MSDHPSGMDAFSPDEAEALLSGRTADAALAPVFDGMRALAAAPLGDPGPLVTAMAAAAVAKGGTLAYWWLLRPRGALLAKVLLVTTAAGVAGFGGLAATGTLPAPLQDRVANVAEGIGIDLPGGGDGGNTTGSPPARTPTRSTATTSTTTSTTTTSTTTAAGTSPSTTTSTSTTTTTTVAPRCAALDARIISAVATGVLFDPAIGGVQLNVTVQVTGTVDSVTAHVGGTGEIPLTRSAPGGWEITTRISGGAERGGEMILVSILGCGSDQRSIAISMGGGRG